MENYYCELPSEKRIRVHEEDKINNPERHNLVEKELSKEDIQKKCILCIQNYKDKYEYNAITDKFIRIK